MELKVSCASCKYCLSHPVYTWYCSRIVNGLQPTSKIEMPSGLRIFIGTNTTKPVQHESCIRFNDPTKFLCILYEDK